MRRRWRVGLGAALGLLGAAVVVSMLGRPEAGPPPTGPILSDCDGALAELVVHYASAARPVVSSIYRDFFRQLRPGVTVHVVCPARGDFYELAGVVGPVPCQLHPVIVAHPMTFWSRDRWLALSPAGDGGPVTLLAPAAEEAAGIWPARAGDQRIADDLAAALGDHVAARRSELLFDGGDFDADSRTAFVSPSFVGRNVQHSVKTTEALLDRLQQVLGRAVLLLDDPPDHHVGMYLMPAGDGVVVVGDAAEGKRLAGDAVGGLCPPDGPDLGDEIRDRLDRVARQCESAGYRVARIPIVPGRNGRTYVTYVNVIIDSRPDGRTVYMPVYEGADALNAAARKVWESLGCRVCPVDCTAAYVHFGALHCLVNVLRRG